MPIAALTGSSFTIAGQANSTTALRAVGAAISNSFVAAGLVRTAATGQVDWTTIAWVSGSQTWGSEIYRLSDSLQASKPVYIRLTYQQNLNNLLLVSISAGTATATDGSAGPLTSAADTGVSATSAQPILGAGSSAIASSAVAATPRTNYVYGDGSGVAGSLFSAGLNGTAVSYGGFFLVERTRAADGTPTGEGFIVVAAGCASSGSTTVISQQIVHGTQFPQSSFSASYGFVPMRNVSGASTSGVSGGQVHIFPIVTGWMPDMKGPSALAVSPYRFDYQNGTSFQMPLYGAQRTFVAQHGEPGSIVGTMATDGSSNLGFALRTS